MTFQALRLPQNLRDTLNERDAAVVAVQKLYAIANDTKRACELVSTYGFPHDVFPRTGIEQSLRELDRMAWRSAFRLGGFDAIWDSQAKKEFEIGLNSGSPPPFTEGNLRSTLLEYLPKRDEMFSRGLVRIFRSLSSKYRSHDHAAFTVPPKMILSGYAQRSYSPTGTMQINYHRGQEITDLMRVARHFDGAIFEAGEAQYAISTAWQTGEYNDGTLRMVPFGNGNVHCYWLRADVLAKVNATIASFYGNALGDES